MRNLKEICEWLEDHAWEYIETKIVGIDEIYKGFDSEAMICEFSSWYKKKGINNE
jgi:hypothetical protein